MGSRDQSVTLERDGAPLRAAKDRPRELERGTRRGLARDDELARHLDPALRLREKSIEAVDHLARDSRRAVEEPVPGVLVRRQLRCRDEQLALQPEDDRAEVGEARRNAVALGLEVQL